METSKQLAALAVVLDHPVLASDPLLFCSAARVCSAWRTAVSAAGAGTTDVNIKSATGDKDALVMRMCSFTMWLPKHMQAVRSMSVQVPLDARGQIGLLLFQMLSQALQLAAAQGKLRLQRFSTNDVSPALLRALPDTLTDLTVTLGMTASATDEALTAALQRLQQLRALSVSSRCQGYLPLRPLHGLCHLTSLTLSGSVNQESFVLLREALGQLLGLECLTLALCLDARVGEALPLTHLTKLTKLDLGLENQTPSGNWLTLPSELQHLELRLPDLPEDVCVLADLLSMTRLRRLLLCFDYEALADLPDALAVLKRATQLDALCLEYYCVGAAACDAPHWTSLPHVVGIRARINPGISGYSDQATVLSHLPALKGLTRLDFELGTADAYDEGVDQPLEACHHLSALTRLQVLHLQSLGRHLEMAPRDCLQLSTLQRLTSLHLGGMGAAVDDMVAVALACSMPLLCDLDLRACDLHTDVAVPAFARLQHLTYLVLPAGSPTLKERAQAMLVEERKRLLLPPLTLKIYC